MIWETELDIRKAMVRNTVEHDCGSIDEVFDKAKLDDFRNTRDKSKDLREERF